MPTDTASCPEDCNLNTVTARIICQIETVLKPLTLVWTLTHAQLYCFGIRCVQR